MATVISLTEVKIKELLAGWEDVALSQDQINALVGQLWTSQATVVAEVEIFQNQILPVLTDSVAENAVRVSELNDITLPNLQEELDVAAAQIQNTVLVDIPALQLGLNNEIENTAARPKVYVQAAEPTNPDEEDRELVVGDTWFDSDDENKQRLWSGVEWSTFNVDIADFSVTVRKLKSSTHQLY